MKNTYKITKQQYNRIASRLLTENFSLEEPTQSVQPETLELIKYLYRKSEDFSPYWAEKGLSYDEICEYLTNKGLIVPKEGKYEIPKSLGTPEDAIQQIDTALSEITNEVPAEPTQDVQPEPVAEPIQAEPELEEEYEEENIVELNGPLSTIASNDEISIVTDGSNLYTFNYMDMSMQPLTDEELNNFVGMNPKQVGYGLDSWIDGRTRLVQIDDALKQELEIMYDHDGAILNALSPVEEEAGEFLGHVDVQPEMTPEPIADMAIEEPSTGNKIIDKLKQLKQEEELGETLIAPQELEEMTSAGSSATGGSSGPFTAPLNFGNGEEDDVIRMKTPIVAEMTDSSSSGPYDANALPDIGRDGSFKKHKKTPAETKTQWAGGGFVELNDCTKLNNKTASTGCSGGAVDNVVSVKKTKGNVNAPSLQEMRILVTIAQKTGKSIQEIKTIIESKKPKA
jgi:hypothetical protein